jgi:hypothetical protein
MGKPRGAENGGGKGAEDKAGRPRAGGEAAADPRFAAMHSDPRFARFPRNNKQLEIDERFSGARLPVPALLAAAATRRLCDAHNIDVRSRTQRSRRRRGRGSEIWCFGAAGGWSRAVAAAAFPH